MNNSGPKTNCYPKQPHRVVERVKQEKNYMYIFLRKKFESNCEIQTWEFHNCPDQRQIQYLMQGRYKYFNTFFFFLGLAFPEFLPLINSSYCNSWLTLWHSPSTCEVISNFKNTLCRNKATFSLHLFQQTIFCFKAKEGAFMVRDSRHPGTYTVSVFTRALR